MIDNIVLLSSGNIAYFPGKIVHEPGKISFLVLFLFVVVDLFKGHSGDFHHVPTIAISLSAPPLLRFFFTSCEGMNKKQ